MKLKSLLLGSAAALVAATGARAADAVVIAEPEPMEYVRICDMYGSGFFYIPGTETCLRIGGYFRIEWLSDAAGRRGFARFAPTFDVRSDTEFGTLRSYARVFFNWERVVGTGYVDTVDLDHAYIELGDQFQAKIGLGDVPSSYFIGYGAWFSDSGNYGFRNDGQLVFTYNAGNGLSAYVAAIEDADADWAPDVEVGIRYGDFGTKTPFSAGIVGTYDESADAFLAKAAIQATNIAGLPVRAKLTGFYSDIASSLAIVDPAGRRVEWSVMGNLGVRVHQKVELLAAAQWFDNGAWEIHGGFDWTPVSNLLVRPEVVYGSRRSSLGEWSGRIRFERSF
jgi:hypothetical protein